MKKIVLVSITLFIALAVNSQVIEKGLYENALIFQRQGDFDQAIKSLNKYIELNDMDHKAYLRRAMLFDEMGQNSLMLQDLETANYLNPFGHLVYDRAQRSQILERRNFNYEWITSDSDNNIESFRKSPLTSHHYKTLIDNANQSEVDSIINLAMRAIDLEYYDEAIDYLEQVNSNVLIQKIAFDLKGIINIKQNNIKDAIKNFTEAIVLDPEFAIAYHNRSLCYKLIEEYELAKNDLETAINLNNDYAQFYFTKALLSESIDEENQAVKYYQKAIDTD